MSIFVADMKKVLIAALACAAAVAAEAQNAHFPVTEYNFGAFDEDAGAVECSFALVNTGSAPLTILSARATCGCTTPRFPRKAIAPGDTAYISVSYDPQGRPGRFSKQVYVETDGEPRKTKLDISGTVIGSGATVARRYPVDFGPLKLAHPGMMLGEVVKDRFKTVYFEGYNRSSDSLAVKTVKQPAYLDVIATPPIAPPGEQVTLVAYVNSAKCKLYGLVEDSVVISAGDRTFSLPATLIVKEDFSDMSPDKMSKAPVATPSVKSVEYGRIDRNGAPVTAAFTLANSGKDNLVVRRIYSGDPGVTAVIDKTTIKKGQSAQILVTVDPSVQTGGLLNSRLSVITNDPLHSVQTIRLVGEWAE